MSIRFLSRAICPVSHTQAYSRFVREWQLRIVHNVTVTVWHSRLNVWYFAGNYPGHSCFAFPAKFSPTSHCGVCDQILFLFFFCDKKSRFSTFYSTVQRLRLTGSISQNDPRLLKTFVSKIFRAINLYL